MKKLVGIILAVTLLCQGDEFLDDAMERYDFASWAGTTNAIYVSTVPMMDVPTISLPTNGMSISVKSIDDGERRENALLVFREPDNGIVLSVVVRCSSNVIGAQTEIMRRFSDFSLNPLPWVTNGLAGDRCYYKCASNGYNYVAFARNNVFVEATSFTNVVSATDIAVQLDAAILNVSTNAPGR